MSGATDLRRRLAAAALAIAGAVARPVVRLSTDLFRPLLRRREEQARLADRVRKIAAWATHARRDADPGFGRRRGSPPSSRSERSTRDDQPTARHNLRASAPLPPRLRAVLAEIDSEVERLARAMETQAFRRLGGPIDREVDHARMIADLGMTEAVNIAWALNEIRRMPRWRFALGVGDSLVLRRLAIAARNRRWIVPTDGGSPAPSAGDAAQ